MEHVGTHMERFDGSYAVHAKALFVPALFIPVEATYPQLGLRFDHFWFYALC